MQIGTAGLPFDIISGRDYRAIFSSLADSGIKVYFPTSITEEWGTGAGAGFENDMLPPPFGTATPAIFDLAREFGIKIAYSAEYLFPLDAGAGAFTDCPLKALLAAGAGDVIHSISNYDEPVWRGLDVSLSKAVYDHVKAIAPEIPVVQIHAPVTEDDPTAYLNGVKAHAQYADVVGFDVYPIGGLESGARTPLHPDRLVAPAEALKEYMAWLQSEMSDKKHVMVLQGFELADLYSDEAQAAFTPEERAMSRDPTMLELRAMLLAVKDADMVFWYGPSMQDRGSDQLWQDILAVSKLISSGQVGSEVGQIVDIDAATNALDEDANTGALVGITLRATDPDAIDRVSYQIDDARFEVDAFGRVKVAAGAMFDFESEPSITVTARASSTDGSHSSVALTLEVGDRIDAVDGTSRADMIYGGAGRDLIRARGGNDAVSGEGGDDRIFGDAGNDYLAGGTGNDCLDGGAGADQIVGEAGNDTIRGGAGDDIMRGGEGADRFEFVGNDGIDYILEFQAALDTLAFATAAGLADLSIKAQGAATVITHGGGKIVLFDTAPGNLDADNFAFF